MKDFFKFKENETNLKKEILGGITTFLTMVYVLAVVPGILCDGTGLDWQTIFTGTALVSGISTIIMGLVANLPVGLSAGLGSAAFFSYTAIAQLGLTAPQAFTAVLIEGLIFIGISFFGVREALIKAMPDCVKKAISVGIGIFISVIALNNAGILNVNGATPLSFDFHTKEAVLTVFGLIVLVILAILKVPAYMLFTIFIVTLVGIPLGVTKIPENFSIFKAPEKIQFLSFDFGKVLSVNFITVLMAFLFDDIFNTVGTLIGVAEFGNLKDENGNPKNLSKALTSDAIGTTIGAIFGVSTVSSYVESSTGIAAGAKTGFASVVTGILFLLALSLGSLFSIIPASATAPVLLCVGYLMMREITGINFKDPIEGITSFSIIITMAYSYSIADGILYGILAYTLCNVIARKWENLSVARWVLFAFSLAILIIR